MLVGAVLSAPRTRLVAASAERPRRRGGGGRELQTHEVPMRFSTRPETRLQSGKRVVARWNAERTGRSTPVVA